MIFCLPVVPVIINALSYYIDRVITALDYIIMKYFFRRMCFYALLGWIWQSRKKFKMNICITFNMNGVLNITNSWHEADRISRHITRTKSTMNTYPYSIRFYTQTSCCIHGWLMYHHYPGSRRTNVLPLRWRKEGSYCSHIHKLPIISTRRWIMQLEWLLHMLQIDMNDSTLS